MWSVSWDVYQMITLNSWLITQIQMYDISHVLYLVLKIFLKSVDLIESNSKYIYDL